MSPAVRPARETANGYFSATDTSSLPPIEAKAELLSVTADAYNVQQILR